MESITNNESMTDSKQKGFSKRQIKFYAFILSIVVVLYFHKTGRVTIKPWIIFVFNALRLLFILGILSLLFYLSFLHKGGINSPKIPPHSLDTEKVIDKTKFTTIELKNSSTEDSVLVYLTLQSPNSVVGLFGIKDVDTIGSKSKGTFYAKKNITYTLKQNKPVLGAVISFNGDNLPCQVATQQGFKTGINIFEFSINIPYEVFDISCEDGVNSIIKASVSSKGWQTGQGSYVKTFRSATNKFPLEKNLGIRGVFPYRCTDCIDLGKAIPENCFDLKDTCNGQRICQVARTKKNGGVITIEYLSKVK